jgi:hypothetical protein
LEKCGQRQEAQSSSNGRQSAHDCSASQHNKMEWPRVLLGAVTKPVTLANVGRCAPKKGCYARSKGPPGNLPVIKRARVALAPRFVVALTLSNLCGRFVLR